MEQWRSRDLCENLVASKVKVRCGRARWQVRGAQVLEADRADHHHDQMRLQVCTLVSTNLILGRMDSTQTKTTALHQQVLTRVRSDNALVVSQWPRKSNSIE